jgi:hypothetical protein
MISADTRSVIDRAKQLYAERLRVELEPAHRNRFVAIEPVSGDYFLADTLDAAVRAARARHPDRVTHTVRIGHAAAVYIGGAAC